MKHDVHTEIHFPTAESYEAARELMSNPESPSFIFSRLIPVPEQLTINTDTDRATVLANARDYGARSVQAWKHRHHATKYGASNVVWDDEARTVRFVTSERHPFPVLDALSQRFPAVTFEVKFASHYFQVGHYSIKSGARMPLTWFMPRDAFAFEFGKQLYFADRPDDMPPPKDRKLVARHVTSAAIEVGGRFKHPHFRRLVMAHQQLYTLVCLGYIAEDVAPSHEFVPQNEDEESIDGLFSKRFPLTNEGGMRLAEVLDFIDASLDVEPAERSFWEVRR